MRVSRCRGKAARLFQIFLRLFERVALGLVARRALGARESRAGVDVVYRAVVRIADAVRDDVHRPGVNRLVALGVVFGSHMSSADLKVGTTYPFSADLKVGTTYVTASPPGPSRDCPIRSTSRRSSSRCCSRADISARTSCGSTVRRCGNTR